MCGKLNYYLGFLHTWRNVLWIFYCIKSSLQIKRCVGSPNLSCSLKTILKWEVSCSIVFKSCLVNSDFYKSLQTWMSPAPSWVWKRNKLEVLLFIVLSEIEWKMLKASQSLVTAVTEIMASIHNLLQYFSFWQEFWYLLLIPAAFPYEV